MLKGSIGNFGDFLSQCGEDVVVLGHTQVWGDHSINNRKRHSRVLDRLCACSEAKNKSLVCLFLIDVSLNRLTSCVG